MGARDGRLGMALLSLRSRRRVLSTLLALLGAALVLTALRDVRTILRLSEQEGALQATTQVRALCAVRGGRG